MPWIIKTKKKKEKIVYVPMDTIYFMFNSFFFYKMAAVM